MTQTTRARIAGFAYLYYIAAGVLSTVLFGRAAGTGDPLARLERGRCYSELLSCTRW